MGLRIGRITFILGLVLLASCGRHSLTLLGGIKPPPPSTDKKKVTLAVFCAPTVPECQSALPALQTQIDALPEAERESVEVVLYVTSGATSSVPATQELADQFLAATKLKARAQPDEWRAKNFFDMVGGTLAVPAAAVVDLDGVVLKSFRAGATSFVPAEIAASAQASVLRFKPVTLALFGAPWCSECKTDMPAIQAKLDALSNTRRAYIEVLMYVTTSGNPAVPPTEEVAEQYMHAVHVKGKPIADEWRWKNFRKLVGGNLALPGAAVLSADGTVLRSFRAGPTTFVPGDIVDFTVKATE